VAYPAALSTTSVAVVYTVMVETGLNRTDLGELILAACFITDLGTMLALGALFATYSWVLIGRGSARRRGSADHPSPARVGRATAQDHRPGIARRFLSSVPR
jgi:hypothetical protein